MEATTTELLFSLFQFDYGAMFCTQMRLNMLKNLSPYVNAFPLKINDKFVQHRLVLAYHKDATLPEYLSDFIEITKQAFQKIV